MSIINERAVTHGDAETTSRLYDPNDPLRYCRDMIRAKLSRAESGDTWFEDHFRDIRGYAEIALGILRKRERETPPCASDAGTTVQP